MAKKQERNFKGVWIPKEVWLSTNLTLQEKVFLVEIDSLDNDERGCFASNQHFADFFGLSIDRCSVVIGELKRKGLIEVVVNRSSGKSIRKIKMVKTTPLEHGVGHCGNTGCPHCESTAPNNTSINNTKKDSTESVDSTKSSKGEEEEVKSEAYVKNEEYIKQKKEAFADKKFDYPDKDGLYDWRYLIDHGKGLHPTKLFVAKYMETKDRLSNGIYKYRFKYKYNAMQAYNSERGNAKKLASMFTYKEFIELLDFTESEVWDEKTSEYKFEWKLSTAIKYMAKFNGQNDG